MKHILKDSVERCIVKPSIEVPLNLYVVIEGEEFYPETTEEYRKIIRDARKKHKKTKTHYGWVSRKRKMRKGI